MKQMTATSAWGLDVAPLIVEVLNLEDVRPEEIDPEALLFREGLGPDSIGALGLALTISRKYGFSPTTSRIPPASALCARCPGTLGRTASCR